MTVPYALEAVALEVRHHGVPVLQQITLSVRPGEWVAIVGPSGAGKSTLLRCFNRTATLHGGEIRIEGVNIADVAPESVRRRQGYLAQDSGLFPHWTVLRNVALPARLLDLPQADTRARHALQAVGLDDDALWTRLPHQLSGGQRQRVALARAIVADQPLLLLDEPFSALDRVTKNMLYELVRRLRNERASTALLVTHDMAEAALLADRLLVVENGRITQSGTTDDLSRMPATPFVDELVRRVSGIPPTREDESV